MFRNKFNPTMLAVVLIALLCFFLPDMEAQELIDTHPVYNPYQNQKFIIRDDSNAFMNLFVERYDEYAKECYKDSTLSHTYMPKWNSGCLRQIGNLADGYSFVIDCKDSSHYSYTHRTPTFEGFIEWLRVKGKK